MIDHSVVVPVFSFAKSGRDRLALVGSGVAIETAGQTFLLTAAHVVEDLPSDAAVAIFVGGEFVPMPSLIAMTSHLPTGTSRSRDKLDLGAIYLPLPVSLLQSLSPLTRADIVPGLASSKMVAWGYPHKKNTRLANQASPGIELLELVLDDATDSLPNRRFIPELHVAARLKRTGRRAGGTHQQDLPDLRGTSGGLLCWAIGERNPDDRYEMQVPAGVLIEKSVSPKLVYAVRLMLHSNGCKDTAISWRRRPFSKRIERTPLAVSSSQRRSTAHAQHVRNPPRQGGKVEAHEVIARGSDLSTFLVHLTRHTGDISAHDRLLAILDEWLLRPGCMFGSARLKLEAAGLELASQKCVCFTETPLEYAHLLTQQMDNRDVHMQPYGIAFPKKLGRQVGVNPVWYLDITPGHNWLTGPVDELVDAALASGDFDSHQIARLAPFIEQMGTHRDETGTLKYRKEFWWEREWRHVGLMPLPKRVIVLCPEAEIPEFKAKVDEWKGGYSAAFADPMWGLEQIISRLAGFAAADSDIL